MLFKQSSLTIYEDEQVKIKTITDINGVTKHYCYDKNSKKIVPCEFFPNLLPLLEKVKNQEKPKIKLELPKKKENPFVFIDISRKSIDFLSEDSQKDISKQMKIALSSGQHLDVHESLIGIIGKEQFKKFRFSKDFRDILSKQNQEIKKALDSLPELKFISNKLNFETEEAKKLGSAYVASIVEQNSLLEKHFSSTSQSMPVNKVFSLFKQDSADLVNNLITDLIDKETKNKNIYLLLPKTKQNK